MMSGVMEESGQEVPGAEVAVLGGGCFWCLEAVFAEVGGVLEVSPGYAGGQLAQPDYRQVCSGQSGHAEVVRIAYDPARVDFHALLEIFFAIHDPTTTDRQGHDVGPQYRSIILACSDAQMAVAQEVMATLEAARVFPAPLVTQLARLQVFWPAEPEHRGYYRRHGAQPYCQLVVAPKLAHFRAAFPARWRGA